MAARQPSEWDVDITADDTCVPGGCLAVTDVCLCLSALFALTFSLPVAFRLAQVPNRADPINDVDVVADGEGRGQLVR